VRPATDDFAATNWLRRDGDSRAVEDAVGTPAQGVRCDAYGCIAKARGGTLIAVPSRVDALAEDCARASIVVSAVPAQRFCNGTALVIDRIDIARNGGYAIWLGPPLRIETVEGERGQRPWSAPVRTQRTRTNTAE
jgi:competence protein ComEC